MAIDLNVLKNAFPDAQWEELTAKLFWRSQEKTVFEIERDTLPSLCEATQEAIASLKEDAKTL